MAVSLAESSDKTLSNIIERLANDCREMARKGQGGHTNRIASNHKVSFSHVRCVEEI